MAAREGGLLFEPGEFSESEFLESLGRFGVQLGLERMEVLLAKLGQPQQGIPVVHVAGTNGKGSVCAMVSHVLWAAGYRVGRYISPHLVSWRERVWVNGAWIPADRWRDLLQQVSRSLQGYVEGEELPTQFEVTTAAAWLYFRAQQVDVVVLEVGLGGRLDATRVGIEPVVTVVTSIGMDHWQRLGPTLAAIAGEKVAIAQSGIPLLSPPQVPEAWAVIEGYAHQIQAPLERVDPAQWGDVGEMVWRGKRYPLPLRGDVQLTNGALALATVEALRRQGYAISEEQTKKGLAATQWPGRLQSAEFEGHRLLMDGAHNVPAAVALRAYLDQITQGSLAWCVGMLETKDALGVLQVLLRPGDTVLTLPINDHLGIPSQTLADIAGQAQPHLEKVEAMESLESWQGFLRERDPQEWVLCGSLYLLGQVMERCLGWELAG